MMKSCQDFTDQVAVVRRLIYASVILPPETPKLWNLVTSFATRAMQTNLTPNKAKTYIENLRYIEPDAFCLDQHLSKELRSFVGDNKTALGIILLSPNQIWVFIVS